MQAKPPLPAAVSRDRRVSLSALSSRFRQPIERFFRVEAASGIVLLAAALLALAWANSPWHAGYVALWRMAVTVSIGTHITRTTLHHIVNDGLMTLFFLLVGLEIRKELHDGQLSDRSRALLPVFAAAGGIIIPGVLYLAIAGAPELRRGWAIPTATDIAFAIGALTLVGRRIPPAARVLLLSLAVIDDISAAIVIAVFYAHAIAWQGLLYAAAGVVLVLILQGLAIRAALAYVIPGALLWAGLMQAGIHPALTGVALGLLTPVVSLSPNERLLSVVSRTLGEVRARLRGTPERPNPQELARIVRRLRVAQRALVPPAVRVQRQLHAWVAFAIMPLFAFANAGVTYSAASVGSAQAHRLIWAIGVALVLGKPLGIVSFAWMSSASGLATLAEDLSWQSILLVGSLGGIGFTLSLFLTALAFGDPDQVQAAKSAVLLGSSISFVLALLLGRFILLPRTSHDRA